jgi:hypothetical protein
MSRKSGAFVGVLAVVFFNTAAALAADAAATDAAADDARATIDAGVAGIGRSCVERLPQGKERPNLKESFPARGTSGYAATLEIVVEHGKGETVLPTGLELRRGGAEDRELEGAGFALPDPEGGAGPELRVENRGDRAETTVRIGFVPLPPKPGRQLLVLPPVPIAIARASGEVITVCTRSHSITVEDPIANTPNPTPALNPPPRRQLEEWTTAKHATIIAAIALVIGALVAWLFGLWMRRPKPVPPPPPPRPPWEVALEELFDIKNAGLIKSERYAEHFDRVSDAIRKYLGDRYGFDGLESTTRETLVLLREFQPPIPVLDTIETSLRDADLVKFARLTPSEEDCELSLVRAEQIVRATIPAMPIKAQVVATPPGSAPPSSPPAGGGTPEPVGGTP